MQTITSIKQIGRPVVGHWVTVQWFDGKKNSLVTEVVTPGNITEHSKLIVFETGYRVKMQHIYAKQIVAVGDLASAQGLS